MSTNTTLNPEVAKKLRDLERLEQVYATGSSLPIHHSYSLLSGSDDRFFEGLTPAEERILSTAKKSLPQN